MQTACLLVGSVPRGSRGGGGAGGRASLSSKPVLPLCKEEEMQLQREEITRSEVAHRSGGTLEPWPSGLFLLLYTGPKGQRGDFRGQQGL